MSGAPARARRCASRAQAWCLSLLCALLPAVAVAASDGPPQLLSELSRLAAEVGGEVGIAAWPLGARDQRVMLNGERRFPMASTYKVAIAATVFARIDRGELELGDRVEVPRAMHVPSDLIASRFPHDGVSLSIHNLLELMLTQSDNTATDVLMAQAGGPAAVTAWLRGQGIADQRVDRDTAALLRDFFGLGPGPLAEAFAAAVAADPGLTDRSVLPQPGFDEDPRDSSTPRAMAMLLERLFSGQALSQEASAELAAIMARCRTCDARLRGRMPPGTPVADKSGTIGGTVNAVGVVTLPDGRRVVMAVFVARSAAPVAGRERVIAEVARTLRDYYLLHGAAD